MRATWAIATVTLLLGTPLTSASGAITMRGPASSATFASESTQVMQGRAPAGAQPGDVLIATVGFGNTSAKAQPTLTVPSGWTLVSRTNQGAVGALAVYSHVFAQGETTYAWTTNLSVGGAVFITAFAGVDPARPVDTVKGQTVGGGSQVATPAVTTAAANEALVAGYYGYRGGGNGTTWSAPAGMTQIGSAPNISGSRSASLDWALQPAAGDSKAKTSTTSASQTYAVTALMALRPAAGGTGGAPAISGVSTQGSSASSTTVTWTTDQPADSQVQYGTTTSYGASTPVDSTAVTSHSEPISGLTASTTYHYRVISRNTSGQAATSGDFTFQTAAVPTGPVPLIVDTDIFSDADDVGSLAVAFALQLRHEANVIAIGVNTRTDRPSVAATSWKCAAAVAQFYRAGSVPIGSDMPDDGTETNVADFATPCSRLAAAWTPSPESAVTVYRRALAAQPDGSVVIAEAGYSENLSALLDSGPDAISPYSGRELVARKVKMLSIMAGGYPSRSGENNMIGNPAAAQNVATNWPTKVVWSGYEVGDAIHTGASISSTHPANSPVRVSYEAFVGPNNWIYSYDLTAVYHAVRPGDSLLTEVGPGTNAVNASGGNVFTTGPGSQYYLKLSDATGLDHALDQLLDALPPSATPPPSAGPADTFDTNAIDPARWTISAQGSAVAAANQELEIRHPGGGWTTGTLQSAQPFDATGRTVQVQMRRAANNALGGSSFGESTVTLSLDATHYVQFFAAGGSLTAWVDSGSGSVNLTSNWPAYRAADMQWLRFREAGGTLYWEYAGGSTAPGTWTVLAKTADPFAVTAVSLGIAAGANTSSADTAQFDNISTS